MTIITQTEMVLEYIKRHGSINPLQAQNDLGCMRLAARISDLRRKGEPIKTKKVKGKNRFGDTTHYAEYYLEAE